jgi:hypothetical protein
VHFLKTLQPNAQERLHKRKNDFL